MKEAPRSPSPSSALSSQATRERGREAGSWPLSPLLPLEEGKWGERERKQVVKYHLARGWF